MGKSPTFANWELSLPEEIGGAEVTLRSLLIHIVQAEVEGFERFIESEKVIDCVPKGIEIRTTIHSSIQGAIVELSNSFNLLQTVSAQFGFTPVFTSFNPFHAVFEAEPPLNEYEIQRRQASPEKQTANIPMLTYGPDLNLSIAGLSTPQLIDIGRKLTFYSPYDVL